MPRGPDAPKRKRRNKPSFDYQFDEEDVEKQEHVADRNDLHSVSSRRTSAPDLSSAPSRSKIESDPSYQIYHKPVVKHPIVLLLMCILSMLVSITVVALDALILTEDPRPWNQGSGIWGGSVGIVATCLGIVFLRFQSNCFAIVVLNVDAVAVCVNGFSIFFSIMLIRFDTNQLVQSRDKLIGIASLCCIFVGLIVAHFSLMSMATCTRFKRKTTESSNHE
ncbi:hypothetical protein D915_003893 [Fasciola hepatica]|uniref:Uncharacterized protein n=1 Tax=Fasciola hepatica TaxID=6192 RepID=A0A4E0RCY7_FASHE|nr:hypothetical protein D915_003893 [Fasciola hepatica]